MLSYFGSKWRAAPAYPPPAHKRIVEPFAGGAGYSLRYWDREVVLIEKYEPVAAVWQYLSKVGPAEIMRLPLLETGQKIRDVPGLTQEQRWLIGYWCNVGSAAPKQTMLKWAGPSGERPSHSCWAADIRFRIAKQVSCIRHWRVIHGDFYDAPDGEATWFVDPPYEDLGKFYPCGSAGIDYAQLAAWCRTRRGQVIACEAQGAKWLPFAPLGAFKTNERGERGKRKALESIWLN